MDIIAIRLNDLDIEDILNDYEREAARYLFDGDDRDFCPGAKIVHVQREETTGQLRLSLWHCSLNECWGQDMRHGDVPCSRVLKRHCSICLTDESGSSAG